MKSRLHSRSGVALVIVLGFLVLISALAVAFFSSVTTELKASRNFASGVSTRQLSESAVNIVMGQIRDATSRENAVWASQPGMIRTYRKDGDPAPDADAFFKLYSSNNMVETASQIGGFLNTKDYVQNWDASPAYWTDLNSPVRVGGTPRFPIIDSRGLDEIEGFDYQTGAVNSAKTDEIPMPVRWIYVLQDGTLTTPKAGEGTSASWSSGTKAPSKQNPIVGRIAFWADDETSKVNLNTAGGHIFADGAKPPGYTDETTYAGSYWDTPRYFTRFDRGVPNAESLGEPKAGRPIDGIASGGLALTQLLQNEFQRYPGHPATTSLGLLFTDHGNNRALITSEELYSILPRFGTKNADKTEGSSAGGTRRVVKGKNLPNPTGDNFALLPKVERLYSSVDELLYSGRTAGADITQASYERGKTDEMLQTSGSVITPDFLEKYRFFMTAQSRAPELNLFGQPRVTVWPVRSETATEKSGLNPFDNVILFCSTIGFANSTNPRPDTTTDPTSGGPFRYIFTRREIIPGTDTDNTGKFKAGWTEDVDLDRNEQLLKYLKTLMGRKLPGFGKDLDTKFGANNRSAILAEIFDYIRCANTRDTTTSIATGAATKVIQFAPRGIIKPSKPTYLGGSDPTGFGRFPTLCEASLVFYYSGPVKDPADTTGKKAKLIPVNIVSTPKKYKTQRTMRAFLLFNTFNPMNGYAPMDNPVEKDPKVVITAEWQDNFQVNFGAGWTDLVMGPKGTPVSTTLTRKPGGNWGGRDFGGYEGFMHTLVGQGNSWAKHKTQDRVTNTGTPFSLPQGGGAVSGNPYWYAPTMAGTNPTGAPQPFNQSGVFNLPISNTAQEYYPFQSPLPALVVPETNVNGSFDFKGAKVKVSLSYGGKPIQTFTMDFPSASGWPIPTGDPLEITDPPTNTVTADPGTWLKDTSTQMYHSYWGQKGTAQHGGFFPPAHRGDATPSNWKFETSIQASWAFATRLAWTMQTSNNPGRDKSNNIINWWGDRYKQVVQPGDTIKSLLYWDAKNQSGGAISGTTQQTTSGDLRLAVITENVPATQFREHIDYSKGSSRACMLRTAAGGVYFPLGTVANRLQGTTAQEPTFGNHVKLTGTNKFPANTAFGNLPYGGGAAGAAKGVNGIARKTPSGAEPGDFDQGLGSFPDGPYANKQDEGNLIVAYEDPTYPPGSNRWIYPVPYFGTWAYEEPGNSYTSPFRQMPSALMMGSLLRRPADGIGWETLSFAPYQAGDNHPGNVDPKDHLLLDFFHMPIVEPYPISEPFSTAGKVNLNYRIQPFDYIKRSTALRATLHPVRVTGVPATDYFRYKTGEAAGTSNEDKYDKEKNQNKPLTINYRHLIDRDKTIEAFEDFFDQAKNDSSTGFFKTASQICEMDLHPKGNDLPLDVWWNQRTLTGDNVREKPYADLYPRITTKSNTYTVHMRVQTLRQLPRADADGYLSWQEGKDAILGEYRGSTTIERYIDPADPRFTQNHPEFVDPDKDSIEKLYRFRTVVNKKFAPQ